MMKKSIPITLIILFGIILRLVFLGSIPSGFFRDEAALGYNSYSILKTGADEFGMKFPLVFRSFEVFFLPCYEYLTAVIMYFLGLNEFSTRFLSALSGSLLLVIGYLLGKKLWGETAGILSCLLLSISPWHIFYSRGAFEGNLALTLFATAFYFWILFSESKKIRILTFSVILFALSMYSYQAERLVVPLFALYAILQEKVWLWKYRTKILPTIIVGFVILIPLLSMTLKPGGYHRAFGVSVFTTGKVPYGYNANIPEGMFLNNKIFLRTKEIASLYFSYFSPRNLFVEGDWDKQRSVVNTSVFYPILFTFLVIGLIEVWKRKNKYILTWILLAPIPAALTGDPFHTYRSLLLYFPLTLIIGLGLYLAYKIAGKYKKAFVFIFTPFVVFYFVLFIFNYAFLTQAVRGREWDFGYKQIFSFLETETGYNKIVIDDIRTEAYIHYLFFNKYNPAGYQKIVSDIRPVKDYYYSDSSEVRPTKIDKFEFRKIDWPKERGDSGNIYVFNADALPDSEYKGDPKVKLLKEIYYPDGQVAYKIVEIISKQEDQ